MARNVVISTLPLRAAGSYTAGRIVVVPIPELEADQPPAISLADLPNSPLPSKEAFTLALQKTTRELDQHTNHKALGESLTELLTRTPADRQQMCAASTPLTRLWSTFQSHLSTPEIPLEQPTLPLMVTGFHSLSDTQVKALDGVARDGSVILLPPRQLASVEQLIVAFEKLGWAVEHEAPLTTPDVGERLAKRFITPQETDELSVPVHVAPDIHQECQKALTTLMTLPGEVLIIVPDIALYAPELDAVADDLGIQLNIPIERSLGTTRLGAWLTEMFKVLGGYWHKTGLRRVLGHPLARDVTPALLQAVDRQQSRKKEAWLELGLPEWLRAWPEEATFDEFVELTQDVLNELNPEQLTSDELRAGQRLMDELDALAEQTGVISLEEFTTQVSRCLTVMLPPQPGSGWPVRTPEAVTRRYDHVAILGLAEGLLPATPPDPPMLDFYDRHRLAQVGVHCNTALNAVQARDAAFWTAIGAARQTLHLSWPGRLGKRQQQPSPYLDRLGATSTNVKSGEVFTVLGPVQNQELTRTLAGMIGQPIPLQDHIFSATQLTRFSQCRYRWYAQHWLGLEQWEESGTYLLPQERGRFNHRVLELVGRSAKGQAQPREAMLDHFPKAFQQAETEQKLSRRITWPQQRPELFRRLEQAVRSPEFIQDDAIILDVEKAFDVTWNGLHVTGKIDRIDKKGNELFITDYKSGASVQSGSATTRDIQLHLYLDVANTLYPEHHVVSAQYLSLSSTERRVISQERYHPGALTELIHQLQDAAAAGHFPVSPGAHCTFCSLVPLCRHAAGSGDEE